MQLNVSAARELMPGAKYIEPPAQEKLDTLQLEYDQLVKKIMEQDLEQTLASAIFNSCTGVSNFAAAEICSLAGLDPDTPVHECGDFEFRAVFSGIQTILAAINFNTEAAVIYKNNKPIDFCPYIPTWFNCKVFDSINQACDFYYSSKLESLRLESMKTNLARNIKGFLDKAYKKQFHQEGDLAKALESDKYRQWGELITAYAYKLNKGDTSIVLNDFQSGQELSIDLDPRFTPIQNAQKYFKIYNKSRKAIKHLENLMAENQKEIEYLESVLLAIQQVESTADISDIVEELEIEKYIKRSAKKRGLESEKVKRSSPRRFVSSDGWEILVGRNNRQNDLLTMKTADKSDIWLHTKNIPGSHVIIKTGSGFQSINDMPDATLEEAAMLAAYFSKARQSDKVEVDYTYRANIKKPAGAKPGMVIYDNYWTIIVNPQQDKLGKLLESQIKETIDKK
jgi:predicted ribosome quality control (RQC) complex YloA/Tae2 family protein